MGYRCRWRIIGRALPNHVPATTPEQRQTIAALRVTQAAGMKTIFDVHDRTGTLLGQVRTTFGGQWYRNAGSIDDPDAWLFAAGTGSTDDDPPHALALLELLNATAAATIAALNASQEFCPPTKHEPADIAPHGRFSHTAPYPSARLTHHL